MKHFMAAALSAALSISITASSSPLTALGAKNGSRDFSLFFSGPGVEAVSSGDEYSEYQWALRNMGITTPFRRTPYRVLISILRKPGSSTGSSPINALSLWL